jgi:cyclophilin family peptidyl-prolyl cis-trans isomerase
MKSLKLLLLLVSLVTMGININAQETKNNPKEIKMERPKYEMSVFQNGKEIGKIILETFPEEAPLHSANFDSLVTTGFYDGTAFHRVIPGFMIQGGDPNSKNFPNEPNKWGYGDPSQKRVPAEFNAGKPGWLHKRGILSAARSNDPNSATSQFFIMHANSTHLDGQYSIYGQVLEGMDVVDKVATTPTTKVKERPDEKITMQIKKLTK